MVQQDTPVLNLFSSLPGVCFADIPEEHVVIPVHPDGPGMGVLIPGTVGNITVRRPEPPDRIMDPEHAVQLLLENP